MGFSTARLINMFIKANIFRQAFLLTFLIVVLLQGCGKPQPGVYKNEQIPSSRKDMLHDLDKELLAALKDNDPERLENIMSKEMIDAGYRRLRVTEKASIYMKQAGYSLMNEYYIVNKFLGKDTLRERNMGINNFNLSYDRTTEEMYIAFFTPKSAPQKYLITAIFYKYNYGWKVGQLECSPYTENGLTAPELMQHAKILLEKGYWLDASNTASFATDCLLPSDYWTYLNEGDIMKFNNEALKTVMSHYKLPLPVKQLPTTPRIWRIRVERNTEGAFPNVNYISNINLRDTVALKKENDAMGKTIGSIFTGIDRDKKYIYYTIYNETAEKGVDYRDHYDLKQKLR